MLGGCDIRLGGCDMTTTQHRDAHGHAPHGWRLNEDTLRWEPVILTDETHKELEQQLQVTEVVKERNRLKKQLMELQAKIAALEAASGNPPSPTDPMQPANATVSQAAAAKIALANVLVNEPKLTRTLTDIPASGDTVPDVVQQPVNMPPLSPALSSGDLSSLAASPLGVVAPEDAPTAPHSVQGKAGPAKKLSFFENSLFSQVCVLGGVWCRSNVVLTNSYPRKHSHWPCYWALGQRRRILHQKPPRVRFPVPPHRWVSMPQLRNGRRHMRLHTPRLLLRRQDTVLTWERPCDRWGCAAVDHQLV